VGRKGRGGILEQPSHNEIPTACWRIKKEVSSKVVGSVQIDNCWVRKHGGRTKGGTAKNEHRQTAGGGSAV